MYHPCKNSCYRKLVPLTISDMRIQVGIVLYHMIGNISFLFMPSELLRRSQNYQYGKSINSTLLQTTFMERNIFVLMVSACRSSCNIHLIITYRENFHPCGAIATQLIFLRWIVPKNVRTKLFRAKI